MTTILPARHVCALVFVMICAIMTIIMINKKSDRPSKPSSITLFSMLMLMVSSLLISRDYYQGAHIAKTCLDVFIGLVAFITALTENRRAIEWLNIGVISVIATAILIKILWIQGWFY